MTIYLDDLKLHLRVDYDDEDEYIEASLASAVDYVKDITGRDNDEAQPARYNHAVKLLAGHWVQNREAASELNLKSIPWGMSHLIHSLREPEGLL